MTFLSLLIGASLAFTPLTAQAQSTPSACKVQVRGRVAQQRRVYQDILFGRRAAAEETVGTVRYAEDLSAWTKTARNTWRSDDAGFRETVWTDAQMDKQTEWEGMNEEDPPLKAPRQGIFETTGVPTSALVQPLTQAYRSLRCRVEMVCGSLDAMLRKTEPEEDGTLKVSTPGCEDLYALPLDQCRFSNDTGTANPKDPKDVPFIEVLDDASVRSHCAELAEEVMTHEAEMLKLSVTYDAAYRSLLQFAGAIEPVLQSFTGNILAPLQDAVSLAQMLSRVPCFVSSCQQ
jgi:hypothetical protein